MGENHFFGLGGGFSWGVIVKCCNSQVTQSVFNESHVRLG